MTTIKIEITAKHTISIDLASTPFREWPEECKKTALWLLDTPLYRKEFDRQLFKREWLAAKVAQMVSLNVSDL